MKKTIVFLLFITTSSFLGVGCSNRGGIVTSAAKLMYGGDYQKAIILLKQVNRNATVYPQAQILLLQCAVLAPEGTLDFWSQAEKVLALGDQALPELKKMLYDQNAKIQAASQLVLSKMGAQGEEILIAALGSDRKDVKLIAIAGLVGMDEFSYSSKANAHREKIKGILEHERNQEKDVDIVKSLDDKIGYLSIELSDKK